MYKICLYFLMFFTYSILGWIAECIACSFNQKRFVHDRGFLIGPYCPIYGWGAMYMYLFLDRYKNDILVLFVMAVVGTSILEFVTSYLMEKIFKARWWDYSNVKFNLEGRICLRNSIAFGLLGIIFIYVISPNFLKLVSLFNDNVIIVISIICFIIFLVDNILSFTIMSKLKSKLTNIKKDSTSEIDKAVRGILSSYNFYLRRLFNSFPRMEISLPKGDIITKSIYSTLDSLDKIRKENKQKLKELKKKIK